MVAIGSKCLQGRACKAILSSIIQLKLSGHCLIFLFMTVEANVQLDTDCGVFLSTQGIQSVWHTSAPAPYADGNVAVVVGIGVRKAVQGQHLPYRTQ